MVLSLFVFKIRSSERVIEGERHNVDEQTRRKEEEHTREAEFFREQVQTARNRHPLLNRILLFFVWTKLRTFFFFPSEFLFFSVWCDLDSYAHERVRI